MKRAWKNYIVALLVAGIIGLICGLSYSSRQDEVLERHALTMTLAASPLPNETSSYELQRAAEHFSDMVLGWTVAPGFDLESGADFSGRRQEKQNLIFFVESSDQTDAVDLLQKIEFEINDYNSNTGVEYKIALSEITEANLEIDKSRTVTGSLVLALMLAGAMIFIYDTYISHRR